MIYADFDFLEKVGSIQKELILIETYIKSLDEQKFAVQSIELDEQKFAVQSIELNEKIKANFIEYPTSDETQRVWEAHKVAADIHYIVAGEEMIDIGNDLQAEDYHEEEDYYLLHGKKNRSIRMSKGQFLILFPDEAHKTGVQIDGVSTKIKKIVFKIRM
ncbi:hypothetical protein BAU15_08035 [Enterococcus sp. JM4C]|uniref:YhcH/YjgK/YiaL family protein n=1 Tax=Candidatus Enterococcus huntleyi TaxID=1857217 RepID=UPI001F29AE4A|nr:YhcH/YjgK/YiaL family protein [Enterococcus sp. JM4C]KAF1297844.1 hypothetical protein BAU15_08035 [Enterococcus sp. JM4C]